MDCHDLAERLLSWNKGVILPSSQVSLQPTIDHTIWICETIAAYSLMYLYIHTFIYIYIHVHECSLVCVLLLHLHHQDCQYCCCSCVSYCVICLCCFIVTNPIR